jgi:uncharacterized protein YraI
MRSTKKQVFRLAALLLTVAVLAAAPVYGSKADSASGYVNTTGLVLYQSASTTATALATLTYGTALTIYSSSGGWLNVLVTSMNTTGYVLSAGVTYNTAANSTVTATTGTTTTSVNLRSGPGTSYASYGILSAGTALTVGSTTGNWYYVTVTATGKPGYVYSGYVSLSGSVVSTGTVADTGAYVSATRLNLRSGPGTKYRAITKLTYGTPVTLQSTSGNWYYISVTSTGQTGYVYRSYITLGSTSGSGSTTSGTVNSQPACLINSVGAYVY